MLLLVIPSDPREFGGGGEEAWASHAGQTTWEPLEPLSQQKLGAGTASKGSPEGHLVDQHHLGTCLA